MATVDLTEVWIHNATDLSDYVACIVQDDGIRDVPTVPGEARRYASGRIRTVSRVGAQRQLQVQLRYVTRAQWLWLDGMVGRQVMLRDPFARVHWGVFHQIEVVEFGQGLNEVHASFTLNVVTKTAELV